MTEGERLLSRDEVAERLGLSPLTVGAMLRDGRLPGFHLGRLWRIREEDLNAYIRERAEAGAVTREARAVAAKRKAAGLPQKPNTKPRAPRKTKAAEEGGTT
jgi:excisionase family DNA binding protein